MENMSRRSFFKWGMAVLTVPVLSKVAKAAGCPTDLKGVMKAVDPAKEGKAKGYVLSAADAAKLDKKYADKYAAHVKAHKTPTCANCKWFVAKEEKNGFAPCQMFAKKNVSSCGWCNLYKNNA